ncbi:hypothetical protein RRG08_022904 [Elysia crispata]|uniref:Uncharacterized protein n=1 Tax=Elysia crispata TaxID=231223 RepID=A0AAE0XN16_9GAST|nr:hypothetical protein RRG08_022904 [Elysia crispata]
MGVGQVALSPVKQLYCAEAATVHCSTGNRRLNTKLGVKAVPPSFQHANAPLYGYPCQSMRYIKCVLLVIYRVTKRCHQPLSERIATVSQYQTLNQRWPLLHPSKKLKLS